jgi:hypothetical protein
VNCVNGFYYKFNPREEDIGAPSARTSAVFNTEDSTASINPFDQQSLTDDSKYVITFLSNLNSQVPGVTFGFFRYDATTIGLSVIKS